MSALDGPRLGPAAGGAPQQLVVFLHGYGADGNDLIPLADSWREALPHAAFAAPHGPQNCESAPMGRQWFPMRLDRARAFAQPPEAVLREMAVHLADGTAALAAYLDGELRGAGLDRSRLALVGFSQGAMLAVAAGLARGCGAVVAYSGGWPGGPVGPGGAPPVLLCHGDADEQVPLGALFATVSALGGAGIGARWHVARGIGHGIDGPSASLGVRFVASALGRPEPWNAPVSVPQPG